LFCQSSEEKGGRLGDISDQATGSSLTGDMFEADGMKASAARLLAIAMRAREHGKCELADILTVRAAQHLDNAALIEAANEERLKKPNGEIERVSAELKLEKAVAGHRPHRGRIAQSVRAAR
jgi:hypothetical protein